MKQLNETSNDVEFQDMNIDNKFINSRPKMEPHLLLWFFIY